MLPYSEPLASSLFVADYSVIKGTATEDGTGNITYESPVVDTTLDWGWLIDSMVVSCDSVSKTIAKVFIGNQGDTGALSLVAGTASGNLDFDDVSGMGHLVRATEGITVQWIGADAGSQGTFRCQIRKLRQQ